METTIFNFNDIGEFLEGFRRAKLSKRRISLSEIARRLKYSSDRTVGMVYSGRRSMSQEMQKRIANYLNLSPKESLYLEKLIEKQKSEKKNKSVREIEQKLSELRPKTSDYVVLTEAELSLITKWYYLPIKNIVNLSPDGISASEIADRLEDAVLLSEARGALEVLTRLGFIKKSGINYFPTSHKYHTTHFDVPSENLRKAHKEMLSRAMKSLDQQNVTEREFCSKTIVIPRNKIDIAKKKIREFCEELSDELIDETAPHQSDVYQLSVQFFRQARSRK